MKSPRMSAMKRRSVKEAYWGVWVFDEEFGWIPCDAGYMLRVDAMKALKKLRKEQRYNLFDLVFTTHRRMKV